MRNGNIRSWKERVRFSTVTWLGDVDLRFCTRKVGNTEMIRFRWDYWPRTKEAQKAVDTDLRLTIERG